MLNVSGVYSFSRIHSVVMFAVGQQSPLKHGLAKFVSKYLGDCNSLVCLSIYLPYYLFTSLQLEWVSYHILCNPKELCGSFFIKVLKLEKNGVGILG